MSEMKYLDFDLVIELSGQNYTARVFNSPAGQASSDFTAPFSDLEIENFLLRVGRSRHAVRRIESPEMASAKAFGGRLFNEVFAGDVRGCLRSSLDEASRLGAGLRVRLHLGKVPALADLPWEYLYNSSMNRFLGLSVETPLVRYIELPERIRPLTVKPPLRVLMMISSPSDYPQLDVSRESSKMTEAFAALEKRGLVVVERQENATLAELQRRLRQGEFHVFHFIGHGGFDDQAQDGLLVLEDQDERGRRVSAQFLGTLLHDHRPLRLAVLNACEGARASRSDPFAGTAQSLVQQGIPAVIAMQFEVTDEAAICFTREFYAAIAVGYPVDAALAEARKAIFAEVSEIEWGTPVLYMRSPDGRIFDMEQVSDQDRQQLYISSLLTAAMTADGSGDEPTAVHKLREVLALDPNHAAAAARLKEITRQQEVTALYAAARTEFDACRWREALDGLRRVQAVDRGYRDVQALAARAEAELARAATEEDRRRRSPHVDDAPDSAAGSSTKPDVVSARRQSSGGARWFVMGGVVGAVVVAGLLLVGIALVIVALRQHQVPAVDSDAKSLAGLGTPPAPDSPASDTVAPAPPAAAVERESAAPARAEVTSALRQMLMDAVNRGDDAEILAYRTLNPQPLYAVYTGDLLARHLAELQAVAATGLSMVNTRHNQRFDNFIVSPDGQRAEVRLTERWSTNFVSPLNGQCVSHFHERDVPQTAYLQLTPQGWMTYQSKQDGPDPEFAACH